MGRCEDERSAQAGDVVLDEDEVGSCRDEKFTEGCFLKVSVFPGALLLLLVVVTTAPPAVAKCPFSSVTVAGRIDHLQEQSASIAVVLQTTKGDYTAQFEVSEDPFSVVVPFNTGSSYNPLFGHRCKNRPKTVRVTIRAGENVLLDQRFEFTEAFEQRAAGYHYRLKREIEIDAADNTATVRK